MAETHREPPPAGPRAPAPDGDAPLVAKAQQGDFAAFEALVEKYERRIYGLAMRIVGQRSDAEEVVQQTFLSVIEHIGEFRGDSQFSTWLMRIATNHGLGLLRKRTRRRTVPLGGGSASSDEDDLPSPDYVADWSETPEDIAARREMRELLDEALEKLDEKYRLVFVLRDIEGLSTRQTAHVLSISEANVKVRLLRARLQLREMLTRFFGDESTRVGGTPGHDH